MTIPKNIDQEITRLYKEGLTLIACYKNKSPIGKDWQTSPRDQSWIRKQLQRENSSFIGLPFGPEVNKDYEAIDVDCKHDLTGTLWEELSERIETNLPGLLSRMVIQSTSSAGVHLVYKCEETEGNQKLARRPSTPEEQAKNAKDKERVLIETRGQRGQIVISPSPGYQIRQGDFAKPNYITPIEREVLLNVCRSFCQLTPQQPATNPSPAPNKDYNGKPVFEEFNQAHTVEEILTQFGWKILPKRSTGNREQIPVLRPGDTTSETSGNIDVTTGIFYCYSTSAGLPTEKPLSPHQIYTHLEHNGDYKKAWRALLNLGYGKTDEEIEGEKKDPTGKFYTLKLARAYIKENHKLRKNLVTGLIEIDGREFEDKDENSLYFALHEKGINITKGDLTSVIISDFVEEYHPIFDFFKGMKGKKPKGLIKKLADSVNQKTYMKGQFEHLLKCWMVGAIAGLFEYQLNILELVLCGEQDSGKTEFFRRILPQVLKKYFGESKLDDGKDSENLLCVRWFIMDDEYGGKSKRDAKRHKDLISKDRFTLRRPYEKYPVTIHRIATLCGTTNDPEILSDTTGNRRVIPVGVISRDFEVYDSIDKSLLWLEAWNLYHEGFDYKISKDEVKVLNELTKEFEQHSPEYELLNKCFKNPKDNTNAGSTQLMTSTEIVNYIIGVFPSVRLSSRQMGKELRRCLFSQEIKKINGVTKRLWRVQTS